MIFVFFYHLYQDYRYYEDPSDEFREEEGTLLPLWKFQYEKTKKMNVTDICFNTMYYDLFAVCFGSCMISYFPCIIIENEINDSSLYISVDFMKQLPEGLVCFFTIKNPSYPDYISKYKYSLLFKSAQFNTINPGFFSA